MLSQMGAPLDEPKLNNTNLNHTGDYNLMDDTLYGIEEKLERDSVVDGKEKYYLAQKKAIEQKDTSHLPPEHELLNRTIPVLADLITKDMFSGKAGRSVKQLTEALTMPHNGRLVEPEKLAFLTLRHCINNYTSMWTIQRIAITLADAIRVHIDDQRLAGKAPGFRKVVQRSIRKSANIRYKHRVMTHVRKKFEILDTEWSTRLKVVLGQRLIDAAIQTTGLFALVEIPQPKKVFRNGKAQRNYVQTLTSTPALDKWLERNHDRMSEMLPVLKPMVVPPKEWTEILDGGYISPALMHYRQCRLIRSLPTKRVKEVYGTIHPQVMQAINRIQSTPYRINKRIMEIEVELRDCGGDIAGLPIQDLPTDIPTKPWIQEGKTYEDFKEKHPERVKAYNQQAAPKYQAYHDAKGQRTALDVKLQLAKKFAEFSEIYFPMNMDWRGRVGTISTPLLSPQGDDAAKGLLEFARGKVVTAEGSRELRIHGANVYGEDKLSEDAREQWVLDHQDEIVQIDADPYGEAQLERWTNADKPFQFLAFCFDYAAYLRDPKHESHLICHIDQTCSGLQHWSAILRDGEGAAQVGCVDKPLPDDIYQTVADRVEEMIADDPDPLAVIWRGKVTRKITKRNVMTKLYGATMPGMRDQVEKELQGLDTKDSRYLDLPEGMDNYRAAGYIARKNEQAMASIVKKAAEGMTFVQSVAKLLAQDQKGIRWTSPIGLDIEQYYPRRDKLRIHTYWASIDVTRQTYAHVSEQRKKGRMDLSITYPAPELGVMAKKAENSIAPNYIHSMDASHLMFISLLWDEDFTPVHDSFGTHASDVPALHKVVRESFILMYRNEDHLKAFQEEVSDYHPEAADIERPENGVMDFSLINDATYFCR
jgi:DNA-directed RNA polymerase